MPFIIEKERDPLYKDGLERGIQKGLEEGLQEGSKKAKVAIAKALLKQNIDIEVIVKSTGLSKVEIKKLK